MQQQHPSHARYFNLFARTALSLRAITSITLAFSFFITPLAPVLAQTTTAATDPATTDTSTPQTAPAASSRTDKQSSADQPAPKEEKQQPSSPDTKKQPAQQSVSSLAQTMSTMSVPSQQNTFVPQTSPTRYGVSTPNLDEKSGGLAYSYPIIAPPGRSGIEPGLALEYTSQDRRSGGILGYGAINIPSIERINRDGTQNLFSESVFTSSSFDGELATTSDPTVFKAKVDNGSFLSYTFQNNTWTVRDKAGRRYTFGASGASRLDNPADSTQIFRWMLQEVRDANDNYITYTYTKDLGQIYPSTITYTGNGVTDGPFTIQVTLETRPDTATSSATGFPVQTMKRISRIQSLVNGTWVRQYDLTYSIPSTGSRSLLSSITETGKDESTGATTVLPPTRFDYQGSTISWNRASSWESSLPSYFVTGSGDQGWRFADLNGDGLSDLVRSYATATPQVLINTGSGWSDQTAQWPLPSGLILADDKAQKGAQLVDINGDGRADIVKNLASADGVVATSSVYLNNGAGWSWSPDWTMPQTINFTGPGMGGSLENTYTDGPHVLAALATADPEVKLDETLAPESTESGASAASTKVPSVSTVDAHPAGSLRAHLDQAPAGSRAGMKGEAIAKVGALPKTQRTAYAIQIVSTEPIKDGVQVLARAWDKNGRQIGFGRDGTVDIERFIIINPPILVDDPQGDITKTYVNPDGVTHVRTLREDTKEALLQVLEHAISVKKQQFTDNRIVAQKVGNTTSIFYPDDTETNSTSGYYVARNCNDNWSAVHDATTTVGGCEGWGAFTGAYVYGQTAHYSQGGMHYVVIRGISTFDTSSIADSATIDSATYSLYYGGWQGVPGATMYVVQGMLANPKGTLIQDDYDQIGAVHNAVTGGSFPGNVSATSYTNIPLTTTANGWINKTGVTQLGIRTADDVLDSAPTTNTGVLFYGADQTGTANDPKLVVEQTTPAPSNSYQDLNYTYDALGNITKIVDASGAITMYEYTYDPLSRLTSASSTGLAGGDYLQTYSYSAIGNITAKSDVGSYTYAGTNYANPHAATSINGQTYSYDNNGNLVSGGGLTNTWDYKNELTQTTTGSSTLTYGYDQSGARVSYATASSTTYLPNRFYEATGATSTRHIFAGNDLIADVISGSGTTTPYYVHRDHLGSTNVLTAQDQSPVETITYYPFGGLKSDVKQGSVNERKKFTGHEYDQDTGLYYMQARYQSPTIGRFVSEDPAFLAIGDPLFKQQYGQSLSQFLANPQQINSYSYVNNNPLGYKDPTGKLFGLDDAFVIGVVLPLLEYGGLFITSIDATTAVFVTANQLPVEDNVEVWGQVGLDVTGMRMGSTLAPANRVIFDALSLPVGTGVQYLQDNLRPTKKATPLIGSPVMCPVSQSGQGTITVGASTQSIGGGRPTSSTVTSASGGSSNRSSSSGSRNSSASSPSSSSSSVNWAAVRTAVLAYYASGGK